jgi:hypothetical protein
MLLLLPILIRKRNPEWNSSRLCRVDQTEYRKQRSLVTETVVAGSRKARNGRMHAALAAGIYRHVGQEAKIEG